MISSLLISYDTVSVALSVFMTRPVQDKDQHDKPRVEATVCDRVCASLQRWMACMCSVYRRHIVSRNDVT